MKNPNTLNSRLLARETLERAWFESTGILYVKEFFLEPTWSSPWANKPFGGLWASRRGAGYSWRQWCYDEEYRTELLSASTCFKLKPDSRILRLASDEDYGRAYANWGLRGDALNFDAVDQGTLLDMLMYNVHNLSPHPWFSPSAKPKMLNWDKIISAGFDGVYVGDPLYRSRRFELHAWDCPSLCLFSSDAIERHSHRLFNFEVRLDSEELRALHSAKKFGPRGDQLFAALVSALHDKHRRNDREGGPVGFTCGH